jgi:hypothetical protein
MITFAAVSMNVLVAPQQANRPHIVYAYLTPQKHLSIVRIAYEKAIL